MTLSATPSMALRKRCLLFLKASAGTPTTAPTFDRVLFFCFKPVGVIKMLKDFLDGFFVFF
jgi:hypothetical protein